MFETQLAQLAAATPAVVLTPFFGMCQSLGAGS
jgi:hypothetical protein